VVTECIDAIKALSAAVPSSGFFCNNQNVKRGSITGDANRIRVEKLVTEVASNGLTTFMANRHGRAADDLEDLILKKENGGVCTKEELPGGCSLISLSK
jgi:hypothetical protein